MASSTRTRTWEDMRREARKLEGEVDAKLDALSRFSNADSATNHAASIQVAQAKATEIEHLLQRLTDVHSDMTETKMPENVSHAIARHRDILIDLKKEFERSRARLDLYVSTNATDPRTALLSGATAANAPSYASRDSALLRERNAVYGAISSADEVISQAQSVSIAMGDQRRVFDGIGGKTESLQGRFPVLQGLMTSIQRKRNKDTLVLAGVISFCFLFLILYWISK